ncbi:hypothetical protein [Paenibacillus alvei]|uniref:hypothetical protein n=1 Tax=Paenibacillus alvei TaxID=44250 RepID=UPI0013DBA98D|nr:hypothetical protein [Paenibacillus alvei]
MQANARLAAEHFHELLPVMLYDQKRLFETIFLAFQPSLAKENLPLPDEGAEIPITYIVRMQTDVSHSYFNSRCPVS